MKAIYFPFTYIAEQTIAAATSLFESLVVYMPSTEPVPAEMTASAEKGLLDIRVPVDTKQAKLMAAHQDFINWGNANQKDILSSLKNRSAAPYLFDDSWSVQIKTDITKGPKSKTGPSPDDDFAARLFLLITQTHDHHQYDIRKKVQSIEKMEKSLFRDLQSDDFRVPGGPPRPLSKDAQDLGIYMTKERLGAWTAVSSHDQARPGNLFVTNSPGVWEHLLDLSENTDAPVEDLYQSRKDSGEEDQPLANILDALQKKKFDPPSPRIVTIETTGSGNPLLNVRFLIVPDTQPDEFFRRFTRHGLAFNPAENPKYRNTIIGLIQQ